MDSSKNIVWMDMEMTGLDLEKDKIMEVACVITDEDLNPITDGLNIVISQSNGMYDQLNEWCKLNHTKSGLIFDCEKSIISLKEAENSLLNFLQTYVKSQQCPLAGNTVYMDRYFLSKNMPRVNDYLHYRIIDVSSVKELIKYNKFFFYFSFLLLYIYIYIFMILINIYYTGGGIQKFSQKCLKKLYNTELCQILRKA
ncbi:probable oligoribonuclease isoform X3 [Prorops nasuta]